MRACPQCKSLVEETLTTCPVQSPSCPMRVDLAELGIPALETVQLTEEQRRALLPATPVTPVTPPSEPTPPAINGVARLGFQLGLISVIPLFPIGLMAAVVSLVGLSRSTDFPDHDGRGRAIVGLILGLSFGAAWSIFTLTWVGAFFEV